MYIYIILLIKYTTNIHNKIINNILHQPYIYIHLNETL